MVHCVNFSHVFGQYLYRDVSILNFTCYKFTVVSLIRALLDIIEQKLDVVFIVTWKERNFVMTRIRFIAHFKWQLSALAV